jgi:hypothetical protein
MPCIICDNGTSFLKSEHIIPESMGNTHYILKPGIVCDDCNNKFSVFEAKVLTKTIWGFERVRRAVRTKKNKPSESKTNVKVRGDDDFRSNYIKILGLRPEDVENFDPKTGEFQMTVKNFDGSENAMSKFLLKVGIESLYKSQRSLFDASDFSEAKKFFKNVDTKDWPFAMTTQKIVGEESVPRYTDKHKLSKMFCKLSYAVYSGSVIFRCSYSNIDCVINLSNRSIEWLKEIINGDPFKEIYPEYIRKKVVQNLP